MEFTRIAWVSSVARDVWGPRFTAISYESAKVEVETVRKGHRDAALVSLPLTAFNNLVLDPGMSAMVLDVVGSPKVFASARIPYQPGQPFTLRTVIGRGDAARDFAHAFSQNDNETMGQLLGYPSCCRKTFDERWRDRQLKDHTWEQVGLTTAQSRVVAYPLPYLNTLLTKPGIRALYHMPCSFTCERSSSLAKEYIELWRDRERGWYEEIMQWPFEYSELHGAAEIRTPVCKIVTDTVYTPRERVIQIQGKAFPKEGANGNRFPYQPLEDVYSNNGFSSLEAMTKSHAIITLAARQARNVLSILDPGCGNGFLLNRLKGYHQGANLLGVDWNYHAIQQGTRLYPHIRFTHDDLFNSSPAADMIVLMPGRLLEQPDRAQEFISRMNFRYLLLYGYSDNAEYIWDLKDKWFSNLEIQSVVLDDSGIAILLERK